MLIRIPKSHRACAGREYRDGSVLMAAKKVKKNWLTARGRRAFSAPKNALELLKKAKKKPAAKKK